MNKPEIQDCFVIMPISDHIDYDTGHFARVYKHIIRPACDEAGLKPVRADDVQNTNFIIIDILKRIVEAPIAICDLSTRNPNVFYELGIRHAFNLPVVLIKDVKSPRAFDVQGIRTFEYDDSLRVDTVQRDAGNLASALRSTIEKKGDVNSIIRLLEISQAEVGKADSVTPETVLILESLRDVGRRITQIEQATQDVNKRRHGGRRISLPNREVVAIGADLYDRCGGEAVGELIGRGNVGVIVANDRDGVLVIPPDDERYERLTAVPFE